MSMSPAGWQVYDRIAAQYRRPVRQQDVRLNGRNIGSITYRDGDFYISDAAGNSLGHRRSWYTALALLAKKAAQ